MALQILARTAGITALFLMCSLGSMHAQGQAGLATEGNVYLINPYADPAGTSYGFRIADGDFNGDGIDDMVISELGTPQRFKVFLGKDYDIGGPYPTPRFTSKTVAAPSFGSVLATGDFNGDGVDELAIGDRNSASDPGGGGTVYVYRRSAADSWTITALIRQGLSGYNGIDEAGDKFGFSMASGDFDDDGFDDLAIGLPGQTQAGSPNISSAGAVQVVYGSASGLSGTRDRVFTAANDGLDIASANADEYGYALAAGDIDADGDDDLAIGVVRRSCPNTGERAGGVVVLKGSTSLGLSTIDAQEIQAGRYGLLGSCASSGLFGAALSIGKLNGQNYLGLAVGAPLTDVGGVEKAGVVHVVFGGPNGLSDIGHGFITAADLPGSVVTPLMQFGNQLMVKQLRPAIPSLAISSGNETVSGLAQAGALWVLHSNGGFAINSALIVERWTASARLGIGPPAEGDRFGASFAIGDFNGDTRNDVVVGAYQRDMGGDADAGGAQVIYQSQYLFTDGFDND